MQNIIEIIEKNNRLSLVKEYEPIVCGNTNYYIKFSFGEDWEKCVSKTAFFVVEGKKIPVAFEGDTCNIPAMPNMSSFLVFLVAASDDNAILSSTPIKLNLERNPSMDKLKKTDPFKSYYAALLGAINKVESGKIKVAEVEFAKNSEKSKEAEFATISEKSNSQVSKFGDEEIEGIKNFRNKILIDGKSVACQGDISNPNLLINGNFIINQRGGTIYSTVNKYTVDRWKLVNGTLEVKTNGILLNGTITQTFEKVPTGELTASVDRSNGEVDASYENGVFTISAQNVLIGWAKLEVGNVATLFCPRSVEMETLDCKRYYVSIGKNGWEIFGNGVNSSTTKSTILILLPVEMRVRPTFSYSGNFRLLLGGSAPSVSKLENDGYASSPRVMCIDATSTGLSTSNAASMLGANNSNAKLMFDAEIY